MTIFIHLLLAASALGLTVAQVVLLWGADKRFPDPLERVTFLIQTGRRLGPVMLACLAGNVVTGGFMITDLKASLGTDYLAKMSGPLLWKLGAVFVTFIYASGAAMGVGLRMKRLLLAGDIAREPARWVPHVGKALRANIILAIMIIATMWLGGRLHVR